MFEDVESKDFRRIAAWHAAMAVLILNQLNGIDYDTGLRMVGLSNWGVAARDERTKAWYTSSYWIYRQVCEDFNLPYKDGQERYDNTDYPELKERAYKMLYPYMEN